VQALYHVEAEAARQGWTPDLLRMAGDLWWQQGDLSQAVPYWEAAQAQMPDDWLLARQLTQASLDQQQWAQAVDGLTRLLELNATDPWAHYQLGLLRAAFDPLTAAAHLQQASLTPTYELTARIVLTAVRPPDERVPMRVGMALADLENWSMAELAFQHAIDTGVVFGEALAYVGLARDRQGKSGEIAFQQAVALEPQNAVVQFLWGLHLREHDDLEANRDALEAATTLDSENPAYLAELGTAYRLLGDLENAERWLQVAVDNSGGDLRFAQLLALFYAEEGYQLAERGLNLLTQLEDDPEAQAGLGLAYYQAGDTSAALEQLDSVLAAMPFHARSLHYKAKILLETGDLEAAQELLTRVAALDSPFTEEAKRMLQTLEGV
jgi:tetratricopeptide (TPR) repeat protein